MNKENEELEKTDVIDTETDDVDNISDVTRKIDLNDLYDGAINNTVIIDPVTQDELLYKKKKPNKFIILVLVNKDSFLNISIFSVAITFKINVKTKLVIRKIIPFSVLYVLSINFVAIVFNVRGINFKYVNSCRTKIYT